MQNALSTASHRTIETKRTITTTKINHIINVTRENDRAALSPIITHFMCNTFFLYVQIYVVIGKPILITVKISLHKRF